MVTTHVRFSLYFVIFVGSFSAYGQTLTRIAKLKYNGGGDWYANKTALPNLIKFASAEIGTNLHPEEDIVEVGSRDLFLHLFDGTR